MKTACLGLTLILAVPLAAAAGTYRRSEAESYIKDMEEAWAASVATNDTSVVEKILADDVVWVLDGEVLNKQQAIAGAAKGPYDFLSNKLEYAHLRFFGDVAVVQGSEAWTKKGNHSGHFVWTDTWLFRNGKWQIIAAEDHSVEDTR